MTSVPQTCIVDGCEATVYCKAQCKSHYLKDYRKRNPDKIRELNKQYYAENKESILQQKSDYYRENWSDIRAQRSSQGYERRQREAELRPPGSLVGTEADRAYYRASARKRRAKAFGAVVASYNEDQIVSLYGTLCHLCLQEIDFSAPRRAGFAPGWELGFQVDHYVAIANGGADTLENVRPAHAVCNIRKGAR